MRGVTASSTGGWFDGAPIAARRDARAFPSSSSFLRLPAVWLIAAAVAVTVALIWAPAAQAAKKYLPAGQFPPNYPENQEWTPSYLQGIYAEGIAVSDKNHHIYVADSGRGAVFDYSSTSDKNPARWNGSGTPAGSFGQSFLSVAVDNTTGDVYVADRSHAVIDKFDENGNLITSFGDSQPSANGQLAGLETAAGSFSPPTENYTSFPIAIDQATHDLYVADPGHKVIDIFDENGSYLRQITDTPAGLYGEGGARTTGLAVTTAGNVYVADWSAHEIFQFNSAGEYVSSWNGSTLPNGAASTTPEESFGFGGEPLEVAAEDATGKVFVNNWAYESIDVFDEAGNYQSHTSHSEQGGQWLAGSEVVAVDQATGYLYTAYYGQAVQVFKPVVVPDVSVNPASDQTTTTATLSGHVDPAAGEGGGPITECHFEYLTVSQYAENGEQPWRGAATAPCSPSPSSSPTDVSAQIAGLSAGTEYRFRLVAKNSEGSNSAIGQRFGTVGQYSFDARFGAPGSGDGQLSEPTDVAVDDETGDVYVADAGNHRVDVFSATGDFLRAFGADVGGPGVNVCTTGCVAGTSGVEAGQFKDPKFIEVDNSGGPSARDVYVGDGRDRMVQKFDPSGNSIKSWGVEGVITMAKKEGQIGGVTVDSTGNLYVLTDESPYNWTEFSQDGVSTVQIPTIGQTGWPQGIQFGTPGGNGIDVGPSETLYETLPAGGYSPGVAYSTVRAGIYETGRLYIPSYNIQLANSGLAVDEATGDVFVDQGSWIDDFPEAECPRFNPYPGGCRPSDSFGFGSLESGAGLALRTATGVLYAADTGADDVAVFAPLPRAEVVTEGPTDVSATSATMTGHVAPVAPGEGPVPGEITDCHFEYLAGNVTNEIQSIDFTSGTKQGSFRVSFEGQTTQPIYLEAGNGATGQVFQYRLEELPNIGAGNVKVTGGERGPFEVEFVGRFANVNVPQLVTDSAGLSGTGAEAVATTKFDGNGWQYAQNAPCSPAPPFTEATDVSATLTNLTPLQTYHYRLVAQRSDGGGLVQRGKERSFTPAPQQPPTVDGSSSSNVSPGSVTLSATINPNNSATIYRFQYGTDATYGTQTAASESIGEDNVDHTVSSQLTGLTPGTTYHYRVVAINVNGVAAGADSTFSTPRAPLVAGGGASSVTADSAVLSAEVTPGFRPTTYHFDFGPTESYGLLSPGGEQAAGSDNAVHLATSTVTGLHAETTYHFRIVAANEIGTTAGPDLTFTTGPTASPPPGPRPRSRCKKGLVRRHGKCVKKKHRKPTVRRHHRRRHPHG